MVNSMVRGEVGVVIEKVRCVGKVACNSKDCRNSGLMEVSGRADNGSWALGEIGS